MEEESKMVRASFICLVSFSIIILSNATDINIDCGSSSSHIDADNRTWVGDTDFVTTGLKSTYKPVLKIDDSLTRLRYFPTGETNCYTNIPVDKGGKVLVRTRFNYGNYDGEINPPKFDVVYDGKHRDSVITTVSSSGTRSEAIFVPESGNTSVCFFRTFLNQYPFVSTIEIRRLDDSMYTDLGPMEGFILQQRTAYGRLKEIVRSPFDPYDRIWEPTVTTRSITSAATFINTTMADNRPPEIVLRTSWSGKEMSFYDIRLPFSGVTFYIVLYFSEPLSLGSEQKRSFYVNYDNMQVGPSLIVPPFGEVTQAVLRAVVTTRNPYLTFKATPDSNLDPLINALELYVISNNNSHGNGTNSTSTGGGGGGGSKSGGSNNGDGETSKANKDEKSTDSSEKSERETSSSSSLRLPLGITIPSVFVLGTGGWAAWKFFIKPKRNRNRNRESIRPVVTQHYHFGNEQTNVAGRIVNPRQTQIST